MKITICGSVAFIQEMEDVTKQLEAMGHEVKLPPTFEAGEHDEPIPILAYYAIKKAAIGDPGHWIWKRHDEPMRTHFDKIDWSEAILVLNYEKNGIAGYIGPNTLIEMGLSFYLNKPIFLLNPIPELPSAEEMRGLKPIVLNNDLSLIKDPIAA